MFVFYLQNAPLSTQIKKLMLVNEDLTDEFVAQQLDRCPLSPVKSDKTFHFTDVVIIDMTSVTVVIGTGKRIWVCFRCMSVAVAA